LKGETVMTLYIGVDFHPHQQTVAWCDTETGETETRDLFHDVEEVKRFYCSFDKAAVVGIEASCRALWFEKLLDSMGHQLLVGDPVLIRKRATSRHKNDKRDAELILELLLKDEFPALWRRSSEQNQILEILRLRLRIVGQRTAIYNRLQVLAHSAGLPKGRMRSAVYRDLLKASDLDEAGDLQRIHLFGLLESYNQRIEELTGWLRRKAEEDGKVRLLMTQPGVGHLTALAVANIIGDISRFDKVPKQVTSFIGLDPLEKSSAGKKRFGSISKKGSPLVRFQLGQAAQIAARYDPKLRSFYKRLRKKKPVGVAKTAAARKLLVKLSIMLRDNISAQEFDERGRTVGNARGSAGSEMTVV
jgi:transposase